MKDLAQAHLSCITSTLMLMLGSFSCLTDSSAWLKKFSPLLRGMVGIHTSRFRTANPATVNKGIVSPRKNENKLWLRVFEGEIQKGSCSCE